MVFDSAPTTPQPPRPDDWLEQRRQGVFLALAGVFIGAMAMLNIIGITHFIHIGPLALAVGVLPYPLTFLCTDLISELFGKRRASWVVWIGLLVNLLVLGTIWLGRALPSVAATSQPPWQTFTLQKPVAMPDGSLLSEQVELFDFIYSCTAGAVVASMSAYLLAQFCDVHIFHFLKRKTRGRHLWLRNNVSTMASQLIDSITVIALTFGAAFLREEKTLSTLLLLVASNYGFKLAAALLDTLPLYLGVRWLRTYLHLEPALEDWADAKG